LEEEFEPEYKTLELEADTLEAESKLEKYRVDVEIYEGRAQDTIDPQTKEYFEKAAEEARKKSEEEV
jgi:transcriptional antiterminator Rof (Rho-off)